MNDSEKSNLLKKDQPESTVLDENKQKNEVEITVNSEVKNIAQIQELDTASFLQVQKEKLVEVFNTKNTYHKKLLNEIEMLKIQADKARDEVVRTHGAMQVLDKLIEEAKGFKT